MRMKFEFDPNGIPAIAITFEPDPGNPGEPCVVVRTAGVPDVAEVSSMLADLSLAIGQHAAVMNEMAKNLSPEELVDKQASVESHSKCTVPPEGWWCSRDGGHEGSCAARPVGTRAGLSAIEVRPRPAGRPRFDPKPR